MPKIGLGTWGIGGQAAPDHSRDDHSLLALRSALDLGYRHFDTAEIYAAGHCEDLLGQAIRESSVPREQLFITSKVKPEHLRSSGVAKAARESLRRLGLEYLDLYLIHWPNPTIELAETIGALNRLVRDGQVRRVGVSNFDLGLLQQACDLSHTPIFTDQVPYSLGDRSYARNGVLEYCQRNHILLTAYTPLAPAGLRSNPILQESAELHKATRHQIALAWLITQPLVITIPMSGDPAHQRENFAAADIQLSADEVTNLNQGSARNRPSRHRNLTP